MPQIRRQKRGIKSKTGVLVLALAFAAALVWDQLFGAPTDFSSLNVLLEETLADSKQEPTPSMHLQVHTASSDSGDLRSWLKARFDSLPMNNDLQTKPMIFQNFISRPCGAVTKKTISLATHLGTGKFDNLLLQLQHWNGTSSVAVYISSFDDIDRFIDFTEQNIRKLRQASFHIALEKTSQLQYPINILRKLAMEGLESEYIVALDVDFIPLPTDCHRKLRASFTKVQENVSRRSSLLVMPAFTVYPQEGQERATADMLPLTKQDVGKMLTEHKMGQFQKEEYPMAQDPLDYEAWVQNILRATPTYDISITAEQSEEFTPNFLGYKPGMPRYWEGTALTCIHMHTHHHFIV